jgi:hypothetical protein
MGSWCFPCGCKRSTFDQMTGAGNEIRTRDLNLGKVALYQLSYSRTIQKENYPTNFSGQLERETRFELATSTLARLRSTN